MIDLHFDVKSLPSVTSNSVTYASATIGSGRTFQLIRHVGVTNSIPQFNEGSPRIWLCVGELLELLQLGDRHYRHFIHHNIRNCVHLFSLKS